MFVQSVTCGQPPTRVGPSIFSLACSNALLPNKARCSLRVSFIMQSVLGNAIRVVGFHRGHVQFVRLTHLHPPPLPLAVGLKVFENDRKILIAPTCFTVRQQNTVVGVGASQLGSSIPVVRSCAHLRERRGTMNLGTDQLVCTSSLIRRSSSILFSLSKYINRSNLDSVCLGLNFDISNDRRRGDGIILVKKMFSAHGYDVRWVDKCK